MAETFTSRLQFAFCPQCRGFGYEVTGAKKHIRCHECNDDPSMYVVLDNELLFWGKLISHQGILQRKTRDLLHRGLNVFLMFVGLLGLAALGLAGFQEYQLSGGISYIFIERHGLMALFWFTVATNFFIYYRLDHERASKKILDYSEHKDKQKKRSKHPFKMPANPTFEKFNAMHHQAIDISEYCTADAIKAIDGAFTLAKKLDHHQITPLHLLGSLMDSNAIAMLLGRLGVAQELLFKKIASAMSMEGIESGQGLDLGLETNKSFFFAYEEAKRMKRKNVDVMELFVAIVRDDEWVQEIFYDLEIEEKTVQHVVEWIHIQRELRHRYLNWQKKARRKPKGVMNRSMTARPSPLLQSMSSDYTSIARVGGFFPLIGRSDEMDQVLRILREPTGHVMLVGPPGTGKTTIFEGLAELMASEDVPAELQDKRLLVLDPGAIIANAGGVGKIEGRINQIIAEIGRAGNIVLGIEDIHHLLNMRSTEGGTEDAGGILMNAMSKGLVKVIATTTSAEYEEYVVNRGPFVRRFQLVKMDELSRDASILVLQAKSGSLEYKHKVFFSYASIESIVDLSIKYIQDRYLPSKALDIMTEVASYVQSNKGEGQIVDKEDVAKVISEKTNVEVSAITEDEREKLLNLESIMHERVVGQDEAVNAVASALRRAREGLRDTNRPIASFLFLGPTGVGKTETAKTIAEVYFGNENTMVRLDMSEYQDVGSLRKMIGQKGEHGQLTEAIRKTPFALVLLDELEKAHSDILNVFLQVLDDGRLTDGTGRTFDMSNTMIIATSNAATQHIQNAIASGVNVEVMKTQLIEQVLPQFFRPEFINRFDSVVVFKPLSFEDVLEIARRLLTNLGRRLLEEKGIAMDVESDAIIEIAQKGYHPLYGARPLRRVIQDTVDDALAKLMLSQQLGRRDVVVLKAGGQMEVKKATTI